MSAAQRRPTIDHGYAVGNLHRRHLWIFTRLLLSSSASAATLIGAGTMTPAQAQAIEGGETVVINGDGSGTYPSPWIINDPVLFIGRVGTGTLIVENGGIVNSANSPYTFIGGNSSGWLTVTGSGSQLTTGGLWVGNGDIGTLSIEQGGRIDSQSGHVGRTSSGAIIGMATVSGVDDAGNASIWAIGGNLDVGVTARGHLTVASGGRVENGFGYIGASPNAVDGSTGTGPGTGTVSISGASSTWVNRNTLYIGLDGTGTLTLADGGTARVENGSGGLGLLHLGRHGGSSGDLIIGAGTGQAATAAGVLEANEVRFGDGDGRIVFNHTGNPDGSDYVFAPTIAGGGTIEHLAGITNLTGNNAGFSGQTTVSGGTLLVNNALGGVVQVDAGATLGGSGSVGNTTVADGGRIAPGNSIGALTVLGDLTLSSGSFLDYEFGAPGTSATVPGTSDRINVTGDLALDGTLNLAQSGDTADGAAGFGYYRLMTYGGTLSGPGLTVGNSQIDPASYEVLAGNGNVDLFIAPANPGDDTLQHWQGGDGVWKAANPQWLNQGRNTLVNWAGNHAVFKDEPGGFGGGTVSVEGTQSFKGLQFVDDGYRLEGSGQLEIDGSDRADGNAEIRVLADQAEIATAIVGSGGIAKTEAGTLVLSGNNTYSGGTRLLGGMLSVAGDANLGTAAGGLSFDGGILKVTGTNFTSTGRAIAWGANGGGFDIADAANSFMISQNIVGTGNLVKQGVGTLVLTGTNGYGNTLIEAGALVGNATSIWGDIGNAGSVVFDQTSDADFSGNIRGYNGTDGEVVKQGTGTLTLTGTSSLDWAIETGGLISAADRFGGDVAVATGSSLAFDQTVNGAYAGIVSGTGDFVKSGIGIALLTGDSSGFSGTTTIAGGRLLVGDAGGNGTLGGSLDVLNGGTLGGAGTVGSGTGSLVTVASGGMLSPGNSIGTLTVDGDLVFATGSRFSVEVNPEGTDSDLVKVTGTATLDGGTVAHVGANGNYDIRSTYTILSAGTLNGEFEGVTSDFAFLNPDLIYDFAAGTVDLELARNDRDFASAARTRNQIATANGIESIGYDAGHAVYDAIAQLADDDDLVRASFDALSGEIHASAKSALIENSHFVRDAINDRLRAAFEGVGTPAMPVLAYGEGGPVLAPATTDRFAAWGTAFGSWGSFDSDGNAASLDTSTGGFLTGIDGRVAEDVRLGIMTGYSHTSFDADGRASSGSSDNYHLGLYGGTQWGALAFRSSLAYTWHDIETSRSVAMPGFADSLTGDYNAGTFQAFGELGYRIDTPVAAFEPFANLAYVNLHTDGFAGKGSAAALTSHGETTDTTFTTLGLRASTGFTLGTINATARGMLGWRHAYGDIIPTSTHAFSAGDAFTVAGVPIAKDAALIEAGLDLDLTDAATLGVSYQGQFGSGVQQNGFNAKLAVKF